MATEAEMLKHLVEARNLLDSAVRDKMKIESYLGEKTDLAILEYGLGLAEKMYEPYLAICPIVAEREFSTLTKDLKKEIKKLTPKPPKASKPKAKEPAIPVVEPIKEQKKTPKKTRWSSAF